MPKPEEFATLIMNGMQFRDWTTVKVTRNIGIVPTIFEFTSTEIDGKAPKGWSALRVKPGDKCTILMAGQLAVSGYVTDRIVAYDKAEHGIRIVGMGYVGDIVDSSVLIKGGQFRAYNWESIARRVLRDYGIRLTIKGPEDDFSKKPFEDVQVWPGETVFAFLDRLARQRGYFLSDNEHGDLVATTGVERGNITTLEEGKNILSAYCHITDRLRYSTYTFRSQMNGAGDWGRDASQPSATARDQGVTRYRPFVGMAEEPGGRESLQRRANYEANWALGESIECTITLQGWLQSPGTLWLNCVNKMVMVRSPMLILDMGLGIKTAELSQNSEGGTLTTLTLVREEALTGPVDMSGANNAQDFPGSGVQPAQPDPPDGLSYYGGTDLIRPGG